MVNRVGLYFTDILRCTFAIFAKSSVIILEAHAQLSYWRYKTSE